MARITDLALTADVVLFRLAEDTLTVLLIQRHNEPFAAMWALPGGFVDAGETLEEAARRELTEETGAADIPFFEQLYTFGDPGRDPRGRVISVAHLAVVPPGRVAVTAGDDAADVSWYPASSLPPLAFDHDIIISYALKRLRYKLEYADVVFHMVPEVFTLSDLQQAYETILGEPLDKRNFRRKMLQADILDDTGDVRTGEGRPAKLYRLRPDAQPEVKARRLFP
ncbi:MAG: NUDIX hydrolase [Chloroflexi bacterium]|nr:NUDIX hydrolase [Chloroflexota bacterium]